MSYGKRSHLPEHCSKEFLDTMRLTALTAEELPAILYAGGFAAELALENPNLPLSALQNANAITEPDLEVVGGLVEIARSPFAPEWLLELALQCNNQRVVHAALGSPKTPLESRLRRFDAYFAPDADAGILFPHDKLDPALALMRGLTFEEAQELAQNTHNEHLLIAYLARPELTYQQALTLADKVKRERVKAYTVLSDRLDATATLISQVAPEAAADRTAEVRFSVAEHQMTPDDILYALRNDPDPKVSREASTMARTWSYRGRVPPTRSDFMAPYRL